MDELKNEFFLGDLRWNDPLTTQGR